MSTKTLPIIFLAFANEREDGNAYLRNLAVEQRELRKTLEKLEDDELVEVEMRFNVTIDDIFDLFQHEKNRGRVAIFHYAGHANSFQLLLETEDGKNQSAHAEGLMSFLAKQEGLKLAVLNGCSTEAQARDLASKGIATIATSNSIDDQVATDFAIRFYTGMANQIPLKKAFDEAQDYVITHKGTANMRDLYWDGIEVETPTNKVPWELYAPENWKAYSDWTIQIAYDSFNVSFAEKARKAYLADVKVGKLDGKGIYRKAMNQVNNDLLERVLRKLPASLADKESLYYQYLMQLQEEYSVLKKKKHDLSSEEIDSTKSDIRNALFELLKTTS